MSGFALTRPGSRRGCGAGARGRRANLVEHRPQMPEEGVRVLAHREVAEALHDRDLRAADARRGGLGVLRRCGVVVLAGEHVERAHGGVDRTDPLAEVAVDLVEVEVAGEDAGSALHVMPDRLPAVLVGAERRHEPVGDRAARLSAVHLRVVEPGGLVVALDVGGRLQADERAQAPRVLEREVEHDPPADRASDHHRPLEAELASDGHNEAGVGGRAQPVVRLLPAGGRGRLPVPRHVEGDDAVMPRDFGIVQHGAELAPVGAGGVEAKEGDPLSGLLEVEPVRLTVERQVSVTAGDRLDPRGHRASRRGAASSSFTYSRYAISTR